jgi:hypothetical protein
MICCLHTGRGRLRCSLTCDEGKPGADRGGAARDLDRPISRLLNNDAVAHCRAEIARLLQRSFGDAGWDTRSTCGHRREKKADLNAFAEGIISAREADAQTVFNLYLAHRGLLSLEHKAVAIVNKE